MWLLAAVWLSLPLASTLGCAKSGARPQREVTAAGPRAVVARIGPLVGEHPLYPEVERLASHLGATETADLKAAKAFLASPLGRTLAAPAKLAEQPATTFTRWERAADAELTARLEQAEQLLGSWPRPEVSRTRRRLSAEADDVLRRARNDAVMEAVRAEMRAIEDRKGLLAELRQLAASEDEVEAARAVDRQVRLWREAAAEAEAARREADARLRELERTYQRRTAEAVAGLEAAADDDRQGHLAGLSDSGTAVREALRPGEEAAMAEVEPAPNATDTPRAPNMKAVGDLVAEIERAHRAAWQRRRLRLDAARGRLLEQIAEDTRSAAKAIAASNGIEVHFDCLDSRDLPDATEEIRVLLRDHWAARPAASSREVALATQ